MRSLGGLLLVLETFHASAVRPTVVLPVQSHSAELLLTDVWNTQKRLDGTMNASLNAASAELVAAVADAEIGEDMRSISLRNDGGESGGSSGLKGYCAGDDGTFQEDMRVEADWKNYGTFYPGKVKDVNKDGTYDIKYDDGFTEKRVKMKNVNEVEEKKKMPPKDDPACQVLDGLEKIKKNVKKANKDVSAWLANQRAKRSGKLPEVTPPPIKVEKAPAPAPAGAPAEATPVKSDDPDKNAKLEKLKAKLAAKDEEIRQLEAEVSANDEEIRSAMSGGEGRDVRTIDDLIAEYESAIARKQEWIDFLKNKKIQQNNQLTSLGHSSVDLDDVDSSVAEIELDVAEVKEKRDELEKADKLDPELGSAIDTIVGQAAKLREKLDVLISADKRAEKQRKLAAERAAAREAKGEPAETEEEAAVAKAAEEDVLKAAEGVDDELRAVDDGAKKLDNGVIPHGAKWWRYRYEHSFVEAVLMIFILFLFIFWERFFHFIRDEAYKRSDMDHFVRMEHSTLYISWLEFFTGELMVCLLVFLTVWLLGKLNLLHYFAVVLKKSDDLHLPHTGAEYEHVAVDMCVVLFWAICLYFLLALSIVHASMRRIGEWAELDQQAEAATDGALTFRLHRRFNIASSPAEWVELKRYMTHSISIDPVLREQVLGDMEFGSLEFQLWTYLRANIREGTDVFFQFGVLPWSLIICTFVVFMALHYYMHMGYVRIMSFFLALLAVQLIILVWVVARLSNGLTEAKQSRESQRIVSDGFHNRYSSEKMLALTCFYNLFILCYGISRVVCQPWMWELHFWVVTYLTIASMIMVIFFCLVVAPLFPLFMAVMALPPHIDPCNIEVLKRCVAKTEVGSGSFLRRG